ncbi:MAG: membrane protein insertase YidC [Bacteroidetes bacterium]|nr:membrane protein insertase YidC [Bacteroidota bacterium]
MKFDKNTVIGFVLLGVLFILYFVVIQKDQNAARKQKAEEQVKEQKIIDSIAKVRKPVEDSLKRISDSVAFANKSQLFKQSGDTTEHIVTISNKLINVSFTNKGGRIKSVELKNFKGQDSGLVKMGATSFDDLSYQINAVAANGQGTASTNELFFSKIDTTTGADGNQVISFTLPLDSANTYITHEFTVKKDDYMIDFNVKIGGADKLFTGGALNIDWQYAAEQQEKGLSYERENTQIGYVTDGEFDYHSMFKRNSKEFKDAVKWLGIRQRFFLAAFVAKNNFSGGSNIDWKTPADSTKAVLYATSRLKVQVPAGKEAVLPFSIYYGPSDYNLLKKYDLQFDKIVNLGQGLYSFVRPINRFIIIPVFDFFKSFIGQLGIVIALLTLFIRLIISPLTYSSYLSGAKMKALRPEIEKLKAKFGADRQAMSMEQMKLFREAGVNPLGGCIPALFQIPIFFALFSFFNSSVDLRGASFLWASDLSAPDKFIHWGNVPVLSSLLGDHLSLFNVTACITSFLISMYSMSMSPDQSNPLLKWMPYIFPVFLLFFFNRLPAGLTWYYTVSNLVTLGLQVIIQRFIINHDQILAKIDENRKKPKTKSKWQERMEQMQEQQKNMREMQQKNKR